MCTQLHILILVLSIVFTHKRHIVRNPLCKLTIVALMEFDHNIYMFVPLYVLTRLIVCCASGFLSVSVDLSNCLLCPRVVTAWRQLAKNLELQSLNDLGFSKRYVRCLQVTGYSSNICEYSYNFRAMILNLLTSMMLDI